MQFSDLNRKQHAIVQFADGPTIITAGPGTGKTRTLTHRIAYLLEEKKVPPEKILAVTFTRSAAKEMKERLKTQPGISKVWLDTFHAIALRLLQEHGAPFGPGVEIKIADEDQKISMLDNSLPKKEAKTFLENLRRKKQALIWPNEPLELSYQNKLISDHTLDFDDLFLYALRLDLRPFSYVLVDEFQDTSLAQYTLMKKLASNNITVIGDPDQAIYGFASDEFHPFDVFKKDFPDHKIMNLSENYRSKATILEAAKQVIDKNKAPLPRQLQAKLEKGFPIEIHSHQTDKQEAEITVRQIENILGGATYFTIDSEWSQKEKESYQYGLSDIVILYRFNAQARLFETALHRAGLPYKTWGKKTKTSDAEDFQMDEEGVPKGEHITLMSLHRSKGLEFPVVFITGCETDVLPAQGANNKEERRLFYVGMTRAKNRLFLSYAKKRFLFGQFLEKGASSFVHDIESELRTLQENKPPPKKKPPKPVQPTLFEL